MSTPGQQAIADGFAATLAVHGQTWTFGTAPIAGVIVSLKPSDQRLIGLSDRTIFVLTKTSDLPNPAPTVGDTLAKGGLFYRVSRNDPEEAVGLTTLFLSLP